ncbi:MAG: fluoride efflux transporter CrcB [Anaerolineaceae bacterium]
MIRNLITIAAGGALGAVLRYLAMLSAQIFKEKTNIPVGTLVVNVAGCLAIGILATLGTRSRILTEESRNFLIVGVLGAFTTFSTFGYESVTLMQNGLKVSSLLNVVLQLGLGFTAVALGMNLGRWILARS